ncbi:hypothetical protein HOD83_03470 [Candidatus Woesearchaeota archaeon]|jgi:hypothetical protein|nr:hypothetical protein [Candidatus Woesearchaeota archaeon]MBT4114070.1 hypothetical protein [Candidatus Woesearchaeota archaeon]MBT4248614.1 hypothetical protein [Candidatus Woesearchaeota archaeon]
MSNKKQDDPMAIAFYAIIGLYIIYQLVKALVGIDPLFGEYGWPVFGAFVAGLILYFRNKLFG